MSTAAVNPCTDNFFSQVLKGNAIVCSTTFQDYETSSAQDSIQSVADNAQTQADLGNLSQDAADVAQTAADQAEAQSPGDVANTTQAIATSTAGQIFTTCPNGGSGLAVPGLPCINFSYLAYGAIILIVLYVLALVSSFVPRPR